MIWCVLLGAIYALIAAAIWADDKSWGSLLVGLTWPVWVAFFILDEVI